MKFPSPFAASDAAVDLPRLEDRGEIAAADLLQDGVGHLEGGVDAGDAQRPLERGHVAHERRQRGLVGRLADEVGDVERVEVAGGQEAVDRLDADVVGVDVVGVLPAAAPNGLVGLGADVVGRGADEGVLAEGLVPDRHHHHARLLRLLDRAQLRQPFAAEPVADPQRELLDLHQAPFKRCRPTTPYPRPAPSSWCGRTARAAGRPARTGARRSSRAALAAGSPAAARCGSRRSR